MCEQYIGCTVSIQAGGGLGYYQGNVKNVNTGNQLITLTKVIHNGKPTNKAEVNINAGDIIDLKILSAKETALVESQSLNNSSTSLTNLSAAANNQNSSDGNSQNKQAQNYSPLKKCDLNATIYSQGIENSSLVNRGSPKDISQSSGFLPIQSNSEMGRGQGSNFSGPTVLKRKSRTSVGELLAHTSHPNDYRGNMDKNNGMAGNMPIYNDYSYQRRNNDMPPMQNKRQWNKPWKNYRDESTFGTEIDEDIFNTDFDFEKNLALFDKLAVMEEIQNLKPDVIRQADRKTERKYRCDENILASKPQPRRQIIVPAADAGEIIFATDNGLLVPSVSTQLRVNLLSTANQSGLTKSRQLEMMGRAATEIIISVIGGSHRLEPGNSHQAPVVVLLCGANAQGAAGVNCGRQLECQGVQTVVITPPLPSSPTPSLLLSHETQLYSMTSGRLISDVTTLPSTVDLIVDARFDLEGELGINAPAWLTETNEWASASRAPVAALDPPRDISLPVTPRIRLCPSLPLAYSPDKGKVYLLNLNIPQQVFTSLGIKYTSPFGAKMVIPLHPFE